MATRVCVYSSSHFLWWYVMGKLQIETEWDKNIYALAQAKAECRMCISSGVCDMHNCHSDKCEKKAQIDNVYSNMADVDRLRVNSLAQQIYSKWVYDRYVCERTQKDRLKDKLGSVMLIVFALSLCVLMFFCCSASDPYKAMRQRFELNIENCLRVVREQACDINKDGEINCQDYALIFYTAWNNSGYSNDITVALVRNINDATDMNHLLCAVRLTKFEHWQYIEPQAWLAGDYACSYDPAEFWGNMYNPNCNDISTNYYYNMYYTNKIRGK